MGKSATGKDTIYKKLLQNDELKLRKIISYTTRPIREGEKDGVEYFFVDDNAVDKFQEKRKKRQFTYKIKIRTLIFLTFGYLL